MAIIKNRWSIFAAKNSLACATFAATSLIRRRFARNNPIPIPSLRHRNPRPKLPTLPLRPCLPLLPQPALHRLPT